MVNIIAEGLHQAQIKLVPAFQRKVIFPEAKTFHALRNGASFIENVLPLALHNSFLFQFYFYELKWN